MFILILKNLTFLVVQLLRRKAVSAGSPGLNPGQGAGGEGSGAPLQCSCLENPRDGGAWWAAVHGVTKSRARLSDFPFTFHFHALEKATAPHSSAPAWKIPWREEPGRLQSMGSLTVRHD